MLTKPRIPILDLSPEVDELWEELNAAIQRVLRSGEFIMGQDVKALEGELAQFLGVQHAVGLNSGTDALFIGLRAMGVGEGDEVITTPFTFFATAEAISLIGATPVFVDVDPATFNLDPELIEAAITPRTKAIIPVHLYGSPANMGRIMEIAQKHGLKVLEDCAQSFGATYQGQHTGTIGEVGAFSFFPSKNLGAYGDGGLMTTGDDQIAETARMLRAHGSRKKYHNELIGYNSRLDTLQAAILRVKLPHLARNNLGRRAVAERYNALLSGVEGLITPTALEGHVFHQYTLRVLDGKRDLLQRKLEEAGISTMIYYPIPVHKLPVYAHLSQSFPVSEQLATEALSLPIWPSLGAEEQGYIADHIRRILG
ncbi:MAG: DegT/DnrJ/EryC1/StrS family aminotransferase [Meiothermus sp.]|nr:DegT/DnrJ/EryC1/StrS family aminotransferase [Meiothermus sp.]